MNKAILSLLLIALVGTVAAQDEQVSIAKLNIDFETCFTGAAKFAHEIKALIS